METIYQAIVDFGRTYLDVFYLFTFMFLSYLVAKYFGSFFQIKTVFVVLIIAALTAIPFIVFLDSEPKRVILSYAIGTSLHETCFKWIGELMLGLMTWVENKLNSMFT